MVFQPAPNCAEVDLNFTYGSQFCQNRLIFERQAGYSQIDLEFLADAVGDAADTAWRPLQSQNTVLNNVTVTGLELQNDIRVVDTTHAYTATNVGPLPNNVTWAVKFLTNFIGRSARGRLYWIGLTSGQMTGGMQQLSQATATAIIDAVNAVISAPGTGDWVPVVLSRVSNGVQRPVAVPFQITGVTYSDLYVDSQRGRLGNAY